MAVLLTRTMKSAVRSPALRLGSAFWWVGAVGTFMAAGLVFALHAWQAREQLLAEEGASSRPLAATIAQAVGTASLESFLADAPALASDALRDHPFHAGLNSAARQHGKAHDVVRVRILDAGGGRVLSSTDASQIGATAHAVRTAPRSTPPDDPSVDASLVQVDAMTGLHGLIRSREILTATVALPIADAAAGATKAAGRAQMEISRDLTARVDAQRHAGLVLVAATVAVMSLMLGVMGLLSVRTARRIEEAEDERRKQEAKLRHQAFHDVLTGLPNRTRFTERCNKLTKDKRVRHLGLMYIDLDRFKLVNDSMGQKAGDAVLRQAAQRIAKSLRDTDEVFRVGGDEFIALVDTDDQPVLDIAARRIATAMARRFVVEQADVSLSVSIGIARWPADSASLEEAATLAELANGAAKRAGANQHAFYRAEMKRTIDDEIAMLAGLRTAFEKREFVLHYQPRLNSMTGAIESMEALLRWQHPSMGLLPPARFIAMLEDSPLIVEVGAWVMETAATQLAAWHRQGYTHLGMSVNVAARQFRSKGFVKTVHRVLRDTGLPPKALELEITEGQLIHDLEGALETVQRLKTLGVSMAIDDFGTGYSSLSYLQKLPIDCIKIDRSFVQGLDQDARHGKIARAIASMAHSLGLKVVAEGVETESQAAVLRGWGCEQLQGFLFSTPVDVVEMENLLKVQRADALLESSRHGALASRPAELSTAG